MGVRRGDTVRTEVRGLGDGSFLTELGMSLGPRGPGLTLGFCVLAPAQLLREVLGT